MTTAIAILLTIVGIVLVGVMGITMAWELIPMDKTPEWLDDLYYTIWK